MKDVLRSYVPEYRGDVVKNNESILSKQPELLSFFLKNETVHASLCIKKIQWQVHVWSGIQCWIIFLFLFTDLNLPFQLNCGVVLFFILKKGVRYLETCKTCTEIEVVCKYKKVGHYEFNSNLLDLII